jgi:glycosyltransferase involved in cell wall biosynthesis
MISDDYYPLIGGMATHLEELSSTLARKGHSVTILTCSECLHRRRWFRFRPTQSLRRGVRVVQAPVLGPARRWQWRLWVRYWTGSARARPFEVWHYQALHALSFTSRAPGIPIVFTNHSSFFLQQAADPKTRPAMTRIITKADYLTAPSRVLLDESIRAGFPAEAAVYIPNAVDPARFRPAASGERAQALARLGIGEDEAAGRIVLLAAARFVPVKGLHDFVEALAELAREGLGARIAVLFAGNRPPAEQDDYERGLHARLDALAREMNIIRLGHVEAQTMPAVYRAADLLVLPSHREATSIAGLEAMASGLPVVGTRVGGIPEIVDEGRTGLLCEPSDPAGLAAALRILIADPMARLEMGRRGRDRVLAHFTWDAIGDRYVRAYVDAIERKARI